MELLAPAGTMENFIAALESGADAIYLGGKGFNARAHAANFGIEELAEAIRLAHILDVSVYVTVNILIGDSELKALEAYLKDLERIGVDAIIVQDLAVAKLAQRVAPKLHLHGSTQMTAATLDAVRFYESIALMQEAGVNRFIEIGPGKILSGFIKKIDKTAQLANVEDQASLQTLLEN